MNQETSVSKITRDEFRLSLVGLLTALADFVITKLFLLNEVSLKGALLAFSVAAISCGTDKFFKFVSAKVDEKARLKNSEDAARQVSEIEGKILKLEKMQLDLTLSDDLKYQIENNIKRLKSDKVLLITHGKPLPQSSPTP